MSAYYNEFDRTKAAWLRELIKQGHIAPGEVDERSINDIVGADLKGFTQCHFFAGVGIWSHALRQAGWSDNCSVWTGSCPCQGFSVAGKKLGFADERHLWPEWFRLIRECRPPVVFGEQSASKDALAWLDLVQSDLEVAGYACGAVDICAAGFGAPHIRQRLYFVADTPEARYDNSGKHLGGSPSLSTRPEQCRKIGELGHTDVRESEQPAGQRTRPECEESRRPFGEPSGPGEAVSELEDTGRGHAQQCGNPNPVLNEWNSPEGPAGSTGRPGTTYPRGTVGGFWSDAEWLYCSDGRYRAAKPGIFPLAYGSPFRVGRLHGYGDAIVAPVATAFIEAYQESCVGAGSR